MKTIPADKVRKVLRRVCKMCPGRVGNGTGHEVWVDDIGRTVHPVLRKKDISINTLYALAQELASKGICSRAEFIQAFRK